jgi:mono/diheme cytochrome c family protein
MRRGWRPLLIGGAVVLGTFALAQAQVFVPSAPAGGDPNATGDMYRGETVYQRDCAGCHGAGGEGGVGPALFETGLDAAVVAAAVQQGRGVMPAGIVSGQEQVDVVTYVVSLSSPAQ